MIDALIDETYILCEIAGMTWGIPSRVVQLVEMVDHITLLPGALPFVEGVVFTRGQVVPALSLRRRFGFELRPYDPRARLVVVRNEGRTVGLLVDSAREFVTIPDASIRPPEQIGALNVNYLTGIATLGERLVLMMQIEAILHYDAALMQH